ncbi:MAG: hypothetical protein COV67_15570 [Nitrospinae bacterium CG11_big_fil_rev_8_21_14_0_20_56_8]|nr:MAG: hypothetical protein COV67_15570 [Nitrospinae bacterium CG11_big_fil_rev_8_21_14_0_20_56_8]
MGPKYDLNKFDMVAMTRCSGDLRRIADHAECLEEAAQSVIQYLFESLQDGETGERACALARFFITHDYRDLDEDLKNFARQFLTVDMDPSKMKCLVLLATAGEKPEWNSRRNSLGHKAIPLPSEKVVEEFPMISSLVKQLGIDIRKIIEPDTGLILDRRDTDYGVFHVSEALGNPIIPAQETFVQPHKIKSVIGFGGLFPDGDMFAVVLFSKVSIADKTANLFKTLALNIEVATLPFERKVFSY